MSKEYLEALENMKNGASDWYGSYELCDDYPVVKSALQRLEAIDNAKPNEAVECILDIKSNYKFYAHNNRAIDYQCSVIVQALIKSQKQEKVIEILKPLCEVVETPVKKYRYLKINGVVVYSFKNEEEFDLLKRYFNE